MGFANVPAGTLESTHAGAGAGAGLDPSFLLPHNTPLVSIKKNTNTHVGHFGEMASWQMRGVNH